MTGIYRTDGDNLHNIEEFRCCKPKEQVEAHSYCHNLDVKFNELGKTCQFIPVSFPAGCNN